MVKLFYIKSRHMRFRKCNSVGQTCEYLVFCKHEHHTCNCITFYSPLLLFSWQLNLIHTLCETHMTSNLGANNSLRASVRNKSCKYLLLLCSCACSCIHNKDIIFPQSTLLLFYFRLIFICAYFNQRMGKLIFWIISLQIKPQQ